MKRRAAVLVVVATCAWWAGFTALATGSAAADTAASCTTDTPTSYCEHLPTGANDDAASSGFVIAEATMGVLIGMFAGYVVLRKVFAASGWGSW